ncbi:hypothetical protein SESBI_19710 [Sesbania bispinosa]|nr:hypothetical protein SESBI_19710 [Sesbania bispinosa]
MGDEASEEYQRSLAAPLIFFLVLAFQFASHWIDHFKKPATSSSSPADLRCVGEHEFSPPPPLRSPCSGDPSACLRPFFRRHPPPPTTAERRRQNNSALFFYEEFVSASSTNSGPFSGVFTSTPAIATEKLLGSSNYLSWSKAVEKWCIGQGLKKHLYTKLENMNEDKENWEKTDALLCTLLWQSIDPSLHNIYTNFDTCYDLWTQAKSLYTNDIQRLYFVVEKLINSRQQNMTVSEIVGHMSSIKAEYNAFLPAGKTAAEDLAQRDKFFMVCTLAILNTDLVSVRDQILASPSIPTLDEVFSRLLRVASIPPSGPIPNAHDTSALISTNAQHGHREEQGGPYRGGNKTSRPKCTYCHRWGHTKEKCFKLHGRPPRANLAHIDDTLPEQPRDLPVQQSVTLTGTDYDDYLRYRASH